MDKRKEKKEYKDWLLRERAKGGKAVVFFQREQGELLRVIKKREKGFIWF